MNLRSFISEESGVGLTEITVILIIIFLFQFINGCAQTDLQPPPEQFIEKEYSPKFKLGYINLKELVNETIIGKAAKKDLKEFRKQKESILVKKLKEVKRLENRIYNNESKLLFTEKREMLNSYEKLKNDYDKLIEEARDEIMDKDKELVLKILKKADPILKKLANKFNFTIILKDPNIIGYLDPNINITKLVVKELNGKSNIRIADTSGFETIKTKTGYLNLQRLVNQSNARKAAKIKLETKRKEEETIIANKLSDINELKDFIRENRDKMSSREKRDKTDELKRLYADYKKLVAYAEEDNLKRDKELVSSILKDADGVLKKVAKRLKYTCILKDSNAIGYLDSSVDITDFILQELD